MKPISTKFTQSHPFRLEDAEYTHQQSSKLIKALAFTFLLTLGLSVSNKMKQPVASLIHSSFSNSSNKSGSNSPKESALVALAPEKAPPENKVVAVNEDLNAKIIADNKEDIKAAKLSAASIKKTAVSNEALKQAAEVKAGKAFLKNNALRNMEVMSQLSQVTDMQEFHFTKSAIQINNKGLTKLDNSVKKYVEAPESYSQIIILGFTDARGSKLLNVKLGLKRAENLKAMLVKKGIPAEKITVASFGSELPIASNDTEEGRFRNRRVEINIVGTTAAASATGS